MREPRAFRSAQTTGIFCLLGALCFLSASDSIIKWLSPTYALHEIMLVRALVALPVTLFFMQLEGGLRNLYTRRLGLHIVRGLFLVLANMCFFLGLATMPFAEAVSLFFVAPLFISALSFLVLRETVGFTRWVGVLVGLVGVVVVLRPGFGMVSLTGVLPLFAALAYACMQILTRRLGAGDKASTLAFYIQATFIVVSATIGLSIGDGRFGDTENATLAFLVRAWTWPVYSDWVLLGVCGFLVGCGGYLISQAYRLAQAAAVAPFEYATLPFALFWGYQLWGDWPDIVTFIGSALIVGSGLFVLSYEIRGARAANS